MLGHMANTQMSFYLELQSENPEIPKIETPVTLEAYNFVCIPSIQVKFEANF